MFKFKSAPAAHKIDQNLLNTLENVVSVGEPHTGVISKQACLIIHSLEGARQILGISQLGHLKFLGIPEVRQGSMANQTFAAANARLDVLSKSFHQIGRETLISWAHLFVDRFKRGLNSDYEEIIEEYVVQLALYLLLGVVPEAGAVERLRIPYYQVLPRVAENQIKSYGKRNISVKPTLDEILEEIKGYSPTSVYAEYASKFGTLEAKKQVLFIMSVIINMVTPTLKWLLIYLPYIFKTNHYREAALEVVRRVPVLTGREKNFEALSFTDEQGRTWTIPPEMKNIIIPIAALNAQHPGGPGFNINRRVLFPEVPDLTFGHGARQSPGMGLTLDLLEFMAEIFSLTFKKATTVDFKYPIGQELVNLSLHPSKFGLTLE